MTATNPHKRAIFVIFAILTALAAAHSPAFAADSVLAAYAGKFSGKGTLKRKPSDPDESIRCRIDAKLSADGRTLRQTGTCVVPGSKVGIDSVIRHNPTNGRLTGKWTDVANGSSASVSGSATTANLRMTIVGKDPKTGENRSLRMELKPTGNGYRLTTTLPDPASGKRFVSAEMRFTK